MTKGTYIRTPEIRERNRLNARLNTPCPDDCSCGRHRSQVGRVVRECLPGCTCSKHFRTQEHNKRIGMSVKLTNEAKKRGGRS